ncbi:MAG: hypothetical protein FD165_480 [Gammaproteobacteria bacterium]|nr:MAG: hypothetical protein FD165_480 [Gammaproteobacteria bacterium]TND02258.1 MAG: hypothetical protein FD120_2422 [Gammaproteobacteria bacterium]
MKKGSEQTAERDGGWHVYIVRCADGTLYTGIATDVARRVEEHNNNQLAAKYTRARRPVSLVFKQPCESRSDAARREAEIKQLSRIDKEALVSGGEDR